MKMDENRNNHRALEQRTIMKATSTKVLPDGKIKIILYWRSVDGIVGYNLYRRSIQETEMPDEPLNGNKPITRVSDTEALESLIPDGSDEWRILQKAFTTLRDQESDTFELPVNPHRAFEQGLTPKQEKLLNQLVIANLQFRLAMGLGYVDDTVVLDRWYIYALTGIKKDGSEIKLTDDVVIQAGHYRRLDSPKDIEAFPGDSKVLILWNRNDMASSYSVRRSVSLNSGYKIVNEQPIIFDIVYDINTHELVDSSRAHEPESARSPGFLDYQRWTETGEPTTHVVNGVPIGGPENNTKYYYQVASADILGRLGNWSDSCEATPLDKTPPMSPRELRADTSTEPPGLWLSWKKVTKDIAGHKEPDSLHTYRVYRSIIAEDLEQEDNLPPDVHFQLENPTDLTSMTLSWLDTDQVIFPDYGEQDVWYRVSCEDANGNTSALSALIKGTVLDRTPPDPTKVVDSEGHARYIRILWEPNPEPDVAGYQIYRTICDRGTYYIPEKEEKIETCDFALIGEVLIEQAEKRLADVGSIYYDDYSLPEGSPVCYAYWVRAFDTSRNLYPGVNGCPGGQDEYICQRLYEETPPPVPIIAGLKAQNNSVLIEWIASPIQDLRAFHIYRSEKEYDEPKFRGCVLIDGTTQTDPWTGMSPRCEDIPAEPDPDTVKGSFLDDKVEPNKVYWYRVSALDWLGNESEGEDLKEIPAVSTFTYSIDIPDTPTVLPDEGTTTEECGLIIRWNPEYDPNQIDGFIVFRALSQNGVYRQVSTTLKENKFSDISAIKNTEYWYRVQTIDKNGKLSTPSQPVKYQYG